MIFEHKNTAVKVQISEHKLHDTLNRVEAHFGHFKKSVEFLLTEHNTPLTEITSASITIPSDQEPTQPKTNDSLTQLASTILSEKHEKERCLLNVIVHNIAESSLESPQSRTQKNLQKVTSRFNCLIANILLCSR